MVEAISVEPDADSAIPLGSSYLALRGEVADALGEHRTAVEEFERLFPPTVPSRHGSVAGALAATLAPKQEASRARLLLDLMGGWLGGAIEDPFLSNASAPTPMQRLARRSTGSDFSSRNLCRASCVIQFPSDAAGTLHLQIVQGRSCNRPQAIAPAASGTYGPLKVPAQSRPASAPASRRRRFAS
jgi:hypothetical protein